MKSKFYFIDWIFLIVIFLISVLLFLSVSYKTVLTGSKVLLTMRVTSDVASIEAHSKTAKEVYFGSVNRPVEHVSAARSGNDYLITLRSIGDVSSDKITFNGLRVLIGQKAEIHSSYFAQGLITDVRYE